MIARIRPRPIFALLALALFLIGSNYCLIGVVRGAPMACATVVAGGGAEAGSTSGSHCGRAARCEAKSPKPAKSRPSSVAAPCCVTLARTHPPDVSRDDAAIALLPILAVLAAQVSDDSAPARSHALLLAESPPPTGWEQCARSGRAPPPLA